MKKLTVDQVAAILNGEIETPKQWQEFFNGKRRVAISEWVKGIFFNDNEGDILTALRDEISLPSFRKWATKRGIARVWIPPSKSKLKEASEKLRFVRSLARDCESFEVRGMVRKAEEVAKDAEKNTVKWMNLKDYENFYAKGRIHKVDLVMPRFFEYFPKALKDLPGENT